MPKKVDLIRSVLAEYDLAQRHPWNPPPSGPVQKIRLPPLLSVGDGHHLPATDALLDAVSSYARLRADTEPTLKSAFKTKELCDLVGRAFGKVLSDTDLNQSKIEHLVRDSVDQTITALIAQHKCNIKFILGCRLVEREDCYPIEVGPVRFDTRLNWLRRVERSQYLSTISARRIRAAWAGKRLSKRKSAPWEVHKETSILDAVGPCPIACEVQTQGLSSKLITEKGLLAARLALTALALMWDFPARGLQWMNLHYDGRYYHREYATLSDEGYVSSGSSISQLPQGYQADSNFRRSLADYGPIFARIGEAITTYVRPHELSPRPRLSNALFLSLWWYHQACRESSDQMATTKFAASMDALAGGEGDKAILDLIEARLGYKPNQKLMKDGRSPKQVIARVYKDGRSRLIHGSSEDFSQDWSSLRASAEAVGRLCLIYACQWMTDNPTSNDIKALRES